MDLTRMFGHKADAAPIPGADAARDAVVALYRTCGFPVPAVDAAPDRRTFEARQAAMSSAKPGVELLDDFTCATLIVVGSAFVAWACGAVAEFVGNPGAALPVLLSAALLVLGLGMLPGVVKDIAGSPSGPSWMMRRNQVCVAALLALSLAALFEALPFPLSDLQIGSDHFHHAWATAARYFVFVAVGAIVCFWVRYPVWQSVEHAFSPGRRVGSLPALRDALQSAGCLPAGAVADPADLVHWDSGDQSSVPEIRSRGGTAAAAARSLVDAAVLGDGFVLILPAGRGSVPDPVADARLRAAADRTFHARVRRLGLLDPALAQAEMDELGVARVVQALNLKPLSADGYATLWQVDVSQGRLRWLQSRDPATGNDVWLAVPGHVTSAHEAVAWSYGVSADDYEPTLQG